VGWAAKASVRLSKAHMKLAVKCSLSAEPLQPSVNLSGARLRIPDLVRVARYQAPVEITDDSEVIGRIDASCRFIRQAVETGECIYGVTTGFGGMSSVVIDRDDTVDLQHNLLRFLRAGAGPRLAKSDVRAAMVLRANSHLRGVSGIRLELIRRLAIFLNANVTPHVREFGSIGASGDLIPLAGIAGALIGLDRSFTVDFDGTEMDAPAALARLGLKTMHLLPKEGLAMVNGTSVMTGMAANCVYDVGILLKLALGAHTLFLQALQGTDRWLDPFIHVQKPHAGQNFVAEAMRRLLSGSQLVQHAEPHRNGVRNGVLAQDRYSMRCLPQYLGPVFEGMKAIESQIEVEMNSATDNPLIDAEQSTAHQGGNFLGQYVGVGMDQLRYDLGLVARHLDVQIALLVTPEFSNGLPACLIGNSKRTVNMGLKGLQLTGNCLVPLVTFYGNSLADRFPAYAEQYNQNVNSQGFGSALLARRSIDLFQQYISVALMFGVQAVDMRTHSAAGHYDARCALSEPTAELYGAVREVVGCPPSAGRPYVWNDDQQTLDAHIARIAADIAGEGKIAQAMEQAMALGVTES
jgi:phenylalanine ammonia-lyase